MKNIKPETITTLVLDIDGTISNEGERVSLDTIKIIGDICQKYNLDLIFLTGRAWCLVKYLIDDFHTECGDISFIKGVLSELGTKLFNTRGQEIWGKYLSFHEKTLIINQLDYKDMFLFHGEKPGYYLYSNKESIRQKWQQKFAKYGNQIFHIVSDDYKFLINLFLLDNNVSVMRTTSKIFFNEYFDLRFNQKHKLWEISPFLAKKNGLLTYCKKRKLSIQKILFAGNEPSDLDVFDLDLGISVYIGDNILNNPTDLYFKNPTEFLKTLKDIFPLN